MLVRMLRCGSALANLQLGSGAASADGVGALLASQFSPAGWLGLDGTYLLASLTLVSAAHCMRVGMGMGAWARGSSRPMHAHCTCIQLTRACALHVPTGGGDRLPHLGHARADALARRPRPAGLVPRRDGPSSEPPTLIS